MLCCCAGLVGAAPGDHCTFFLNGDDADYVAAGHGDSVVMLLINAAAGDDVDHGGGSDHADN